MRARCYRCQNTFETDRFGTQACPSCGGEIYLPDPSAPAAGSGEQGQPGSQPFPPAGVGGPGWGGSPQGWAPPSSNATRWTTLPPAAAPLPPEESAPFAERARRGVLSSFVETWKLAAVEPARFFRQVRISEVRAAVFFGTIALTLGNWASLLFGYMTASATAGLMAEIARRVGEGRVDALPILQLMQGITLRSLAVQMLLTPLLALAGLYLTAGLFHVLLLIVRGAPRGFDATLTLVGYASGIFLLRALPVCGGLVATVWFMVAAIQGLAEIQRCGIGKAAFGVLMPVALLFLCACAAGVFIGMAGLAGMGGHGAGNVPGATGL